MLRLFSLLLLLMAFTSQASNRLYADNNLDSSDGFLWDWTFGAEYYHEAPFLVGLENDNNGLEFNVNLALSYNDFYLDFDQSQLTGGAVLGYKLFDSEPWTLDIIAVQLQSGFDEYGGAIYSGPLIKELEGITPRQADYDAGLRLTRTNGDTQLNLEILHDIAGAHQSLIVSTFISHIRPWKNWEFRSGVGLSYYPKTYTNYYFGVTPEEVRAFRPVFEASNAFAMQFEFHAEYPLSRHWVFLGGWLTTWFSSGIGDSPLVEQPYQHKAKVGIRYVF